MGPGFKPTVKQPDFKTLTLDLGKQGETILEVLSCVKEYTISKFIINILPEHLAPKKKSLQELH